MNNLIPLMRREWLQHRFVWTMLTLVPLGLAVLLLSFGQVEMGDAMAERPPEDVAAVMGGMTIVVTAAILFLLVWVTSVFVTSGLARRDHGDRSIEFWLSLPTGHAESYAAPLLVHLLLAPAAALLVGLAGGYAMSLLVVSRFIGFSDWLSLPWGHILAATIALTGRVLAGLPLATLWLSPLILLAVLANALFKRWGLPVLAVGVGLGSVVLKYVFGQPVLGEVIARLGNEAATALIGASMQSPTPDRPSAAAMLQALPGWAVNDLGAALTNAASPAMLGALAVAAALFAALVYWRRKGAGITG
jgi:ABC-2 type transport system permease protein